MAKKMIIGGVEVDDMLKDIEPIPTLDEVLGPADTIYSPANSCLYFTVCIGEICPCHLIDATVVVPQIKTYIKEG